MRHLVRTVVDDTLAALVAKGQLAVPQPSNYQVDVPRSAEHGDWSCNVAMTLTKVAGRPAEEIAAAIAGGLVDRAGVVISVQVAKPGFLNFRLADRVFQQVAREVLAAGESWGRRPPKSSGTRVLVEFVSANPTGPVHIGHARGAFVGDALARLLSAAGHEVTREFYINDFGNQVDTLGRTVYKRYRQQFGETVTLVEGEYPAEYVVDIAKAWKAQVGDRFMPRSAAHQGGTVADQEAVAEASAFAIAYNLNGIKATLGRAQITHDVFTSEAALHAANKVRNVVEVFRARGVTYQAAEGRRREKGEKVRSEDSKAAQYADRQKGGTYLMTATYQENGKYVLKDDEDRIILRHDGTPVYLTADLAYHKDKFDRGFDLVVDVFGADHGGHVPRIQSGMQLLGIDPKRLRFVQVQIVRITRGGEEVKVSKRKGTVFELEDLIEEAGPDVCRFLFLSKTPNAQFDFDLNAVKQQSKENPVFYFQYGHARCASILRRAEEKGVPFVGAAALTEAQLSRLVLPEEKAMLKKMSQLPDIVIGAAERLEPHQVLYFCHELIGDFHSYYTTTRADPIIGTDPAKTQGRLALVAALQHTLRSAFAILGISAPDSMEAPDDEPPPAFGEGGVAHPSGG